MFTAPKIGQIVTVRGMECRIIAIRPAGTIDVESLAHSPTCNDANDRSPVERCICQRYFRVSGLAF